MFSKITGATAVALLAAVARAQDGPPAYTAPSHTEVSKAPESTSTAVAVSSSSSSSSSAPVTAPEASSKTSSSVDSTITPPPASTAADGQVYVTSTVYKTTEITILSCAETVTDCPARSHAQTHTVVTTATVPDYVTICPVTASLGVPKPSSVAPYTTLGLSSTPISTFVSGSAPVTTAEATSKPSDSSSKPSESASKPSESASKSAESTTESIKTIMVTPIPETSADHSSSTHGAPGYGSGPVTSEKPSTTAEASSKESSTEKPSTTAEASSKESSTEKPSTTAEASSSKPVIPGYGPGVHSSESTTPLATSKTFSGTAGTAGTVGTAGRTAVPTSHGPFSMHNGTDHTRRPTGTGTGAVVVTTKPVEASQTVTIDVGSGSQVTKTIEMTSYETIMTTLYETETETVPVVTSAVGTTEITTPVAVTFTNNGEQKTTTMDITQTHTIFSTLHLTSTARITETVPAPSSIASAPGYNNENGSGSPSSVPAHNQAGSESATTPAAGENVATGGPGPAPTTGPASPVGNECPACECSGSGEKETVTVTLPKETVYVTMNSMGSATASVVTQPLATSTGARYPVGNGTHPHHHHSSGFARPTGTGVSSGFLTSTKPADVSKSPISSVVAPSSSDVKVSSSSSAAKTSSAATSSAAAPPKYTAPPGYGKRFFGLF